MPSVSLNVPHVRDDNNTLSILRDDLSEAGLVSASDVLEGGDGFVRITFADAGKRGQIEARIRSFDFDRAQAIEEKFRQIDAQAEAELRAPVEAKRKAHRTAVRALPSKAAIQAYDAKAGW